MKRKNAHTEDNALLLIITPLQASIASSAVEDLGVSSYDVLFFTRYPGIATEKAFQKLERNAANAKLLSTNLRQPDLIVQFLFWSRANHLLGRWKASYRYVIFGSIDTPFIVSLALRSKAQFVTVDDGVANVQRDSSYFVERTAFRSRFHHAVFGSIGLASAKSRILSHYTIFPQFENIVTSEKIRVARNWALPFPASASNRELTFLIGTAETLWLDSSQIEAVRRYLSSCRVDFYVPHPMQETPLLPAAPILDKRGHLGEDAILQTAGQNKIHLVGLMSTMFITLQLHAARKTLIVPEGHEHYIPLAEELGCEIVRLKVGM